MSKMFRLTDEEEELIRKKAVEINKTLISKGKEPIRDSELTLRLLKLALKNAYIIDGKIEITGN